MTQTKPKTETTEVAPMTMEQAAMIPSKEQSSLLRQAGQTIAEMMLFDDRIFEKVSKMGEIMATAKTTIPQHLRGSVGDCTAIIMQGMRWGVDPYAVAQKTHVISGVMGYEAQLVNAVILKNAPIEGRPKYEWFGEWEKILGNFKTVKSQKGNDYQVPNWNSADEKGLGVKITVQVKGEDDPTEFTLLLSQATVRNSTLWAADPRQQLAYLAMKRMARIYFPDVLMGVYTPDEIDGGEVATYYNEDTIEGEAVTVEEDDAPKTKTGAFAASASAADDETKAAVAAENKKAAEATGDLVDQAEGVKVDPSEKDLPEPLQKKVYVVKAPGANARGELPYNSAQEAGDALLKALNARKGNVNKQKEIDEILTMNTGLIAEIRKELPDLAMEIVGVKK